jgi:hypothetical protein
MLRRLERQMVQYDRYAGAEIVVETEGVTVEPEY